MEYIEMGNPAIVSRADLAWQEVDELFLKWTSTDESKDISIKNDYYIMLWEKIFEAAIIRGKSGKFRYSSEESPSGKDEYSIICAAISEIFLGGKVSCDFVPSKENGFSHYIKKVLKFKKDDIRINGDKEKNVQNKEKIRKMINGVYQQLQSQDTNHGVTVEMIYAILQSGKYPVIQRCEIEDFLAGKAVDHIRLDDKRGDSDEETVGEKLYHDYPEIFPDYHPDFSADRIPDLLESMKKWILSKKEKTGCIYMTFYVQMIKKALRSETSESLAKYYRSLLADLPDHSWAMDITDKEMAIRFDHTQEYICKLRKQFKTQCELFFKERGAT